MATVKNYFEFITESKKIDPFTEFATKRLAGAAKISQNAKAKGGPSMLTYYHFVVKLPYYKAAAAGKFNTASATTELKKLNSELAALLKTFEPKDQIPFQKIMGKIEVVGELLIKDSEKKS